MKIRIWMPTLVGALTAMMLTVPGVYAQEADVSPFAREGVYVAAGPSYGFLDDKVDGEFEDSEGFNGRIGYRAHPKIAVEGEFEFINSLDRSANTRRNKAENLWVATVNAKIFMLTHRVQPYLLVGLGFSLFDEIDHDDGDPDDGDPDEEERNDFEARVGVGTDVYLTSFLYGYIEGSYAITTGELQEFAYLSWTTGVGIRF